MAASWTGRILDETRFLGAADASLRIPVIVTDISGIVTADSVLS